ncbi:MAG: hypothetical protein UR88_C0007G0013 [Candidatus Nomurabacteria bacterium GW2011_GWA1_35_8]|uniref:Transposase IS200-like domain-containing protein n=1 Tax=Candidatus Nomurabacteria bacterium GW2011_GWA1_35_8 TaxID=1618727 RepID=A0A0G0CVB6_9BACT|nr:MAG: hypothetical protein UR88_C0007G0013 [Candidatus Nomurabacteria bacterium GW2011_GWA1_35_8]
MNPIILDFFFVYFIFNQIQLLIILVSILHILEKIKNLIYLLILSYTKYFNAKYKRTGHLFQGPYQAVHVEDNEQLLHLSAYIHKNPKEIKNVNNKKLIKYPWSSFQDYILENRWPEFLKPNIILEQFNNKAKYVDFVNTSLAKEEK